ncbi:MAG: GlcG/HbpS family heme-binding protein [Granulosicoccaceae bacterium]
MKTQVILELPDVKRALDAAEREALANQWSVTIAVCDAGGVPLGMLRMDGAPVMSAMVAPEKARTSVLTGKSSGVFEQMVNQGRYAALSMPVVPLEGGEPILIDNQVVGAVGVSGVKAGEDAQVARAGVAAILATCENCEPCCC